MSKVLTVDTPVQQAVFDALRDEIINGFWAGGRPANHAEVWKDVSVAIGDQLGRNFEIQRTYNFFNPQFYGTKEAELLEIAKKVNPSITSKALRREIERLNQIIGGRLKSKNAAPTKLARGKKASASNKSHSGVTVTRVPAKFC